MLRNDLVAHEDFIGLYEIDFIGSSLLRMNLSCYDGASNMSETKKDAEARVVYTPTTSEKIEFEVMHDALDTT